MLNTVGDSNIVKKYTVNDDGTLTPSDVSSLGDLQNNAVYLIIEEKMRKIFIWKGEEAPVRRKFISAKAAQQMRQEEYGMVFRIDSLDPGTEGREFLSIFGESTAAPNLHLPTSLLWSRAAGICS